MTCRSCMKTAMVTGLSLAFASLAIADETIYADALSSGWAVGGSATVNLNNAAPAVSGTSISVTEGANQAFVLNRKQPAGGLAYTALQFQIHGGMTGGQKLVVQAQLASGSAGLPVYTLPTLPKNAWTTVTVPLVALGVSAATNITGFQIANSTGAAVPTYYLDNVTFVQKLTLAIPNAGLIFDESFRNGWYSASWASVSVSSACAHAGRNALKVDSGAWGALYFQNPSQSGADDIRTTDYNGVSFWINGGDKGGQSLYVQATTTDQPGGNNTRPGVAVGPLAANTWLKVTVPFSKLGVNPSTKINGFWLQEWRGQTIPSFYVDDVSLTAAPLPSSVAITVDPTKVVTKVDPRMFGINVASWNTALAESGTPAMVKEAGIGVMRFPGGSFSDDYHWQTNTVEGSPNSSAWLTPFATFQKMVNNLNLQAVITANYGTGTSDEAAAWVKQANTGQTNYIHQWEIGNECFGGWEDDKHARPHDPFTYATLAKDYIDKMKAADSRVQVGVVVVADEDSFANYTDHPVKNPRTGVTHNGWTPVMLATLKKLNRRPDFVIYHYYAENPGGETDAGLLNASGNWARDIPAIRQMLNDYYGATDGPKIKIVVTENNAISFNPGKQMTSLVNALYYADSIGAALNTEMTGFIWWDWRNGELYDQNNSNDLYGWRMYGDYGLVSSTNERYPAFYATKAVSRFVRGGESIVATTSSYSGLSAYGALRSNGDLCLLVVNKRSAAMTGTLDLGAFISSGSVAVTSYGIPQDEAVRLHTGSGDLASTSLTNWPATKGAYTFPGYSLTVLRFTKKANP